MNMRDLIKLCEQHSFVHPSPEEEHDEVAWQLEGDLPDSVRAHLEELRDPKVFAAAVRNGDVRMVSPKEAASHILNTGGDDLDPEKEARVAQKFEAGETISMPIVLSHNGKKWLLGGHHRLTHSSKVLKQDTPVLHIERGAQ